MKTKEQLVEINTPCGRPFYVLPSEVTAITPHNVKPNDLSFVICISGMQIEVVGPTEDIMACLRQHETFLGREIDQDGELK